MEHGANMPKVVPRYAARLEHVGEGCQLVAQCLRCGHRNELDVAALRARLPAATHLNGLERKLRCTACRSRECHATIRWPGQPAP
jgi:DNA-directed RNA polymerase subunit RPC12/RpoP